MSADQTARADREAPSGPSIAAEQAALLVATVTQYSGVEQIRSASVHADSHASATVEVGTTAWEVDWQFTPIDSPDPSIETIEARVVFRLRRGALAEAGVAVSVVLTDWDTANYVLMPAAVYDGNRFQVSHQPYPPIQFRSEEIGPDAPVVISDVPRLNVGPGESRIALRSGDLAFPAVAVFDRRRERGLIVSTSQRGSLGDHGIAFEENPDSTQATLSLQSPSMRALRYGSGTTSYPSEDRGHDFSEGDEVEMRFCLHSFDCATIPEIFRHVNAIRTDYDDRRPLRQEIPFSAAWRIVQEKYNRDNWQEQEGFYRSSTSGHEIYGEWQTGWVGSPIVDYAMMLSGSPESVERSRRALDFLFSTMQAPSGFFHGIYSRGRLRGDNFRDHDDADWLLIRKHADAVYFVGKLFSGLLERGDPIPQRWMQGYVSACDALVQLWRRHGQFGQHVHIGSGDVLVGGSSGAAIAPAGLVIAARLLRDAEYLKIAEESAQHYYERFVRQGITTGAPGEALQCPESESAFALVESFVSLHDATGDEQWREKAVDAANLFASWCVSYDFEFPPSSEFAKMGLGTKGAVWANAQNKHAAPGICTHSGLGLLKLFRATGNRAYLELLRDIAHILPTFMSRADRPLHRTFPPVERRGEASPPGWMGERVNTSDWEGPENVGGVDGGSCWCEVSLMLTWLEIPGVYVVPDVGLAVAFDHLDVEIEPGGQAVVLTNPTAFEAATRLLIEDARDMSVPLGDAPMLNWPVVTIPAGGTLTVPLQSR